MKFSRTFKVIWWVAMLIIAGLLLLARWEAISAGQGTTFDTGLLAVITALAAVPLFSEFSFLGLSVKQHIEEAKKELSQEIREQTIHLRSDLFNAISVQSRADSHIHINSSAPDSILDELRQEIRDAVQRVNPELTNGDREALLPSGIVTDEALLAFTSRYSIEQEVQNLWEHVFREEAPRRGIYSLTESLVAEEVLPPKLAASVHQVWRVASPAVHAEPISQEKVKFLREVVPGLYAALREIREQWSDRGGQHRPAGSSHVERGREQVTGG